MIFKSKHNSTLQHSSSQTHPTETSIPNPFSHRHHHHQLHRRHHDSLLTTMNSPAYPPRPISLPPSPSPAPAPYLSGPASQLASAVQPPPPPPPPSRAPVRFSPPLIVMVAVVATAFLIVFYSRLISRHLIRLSRWRRRRRITRSSYLHSPSVDLNSPPATTFFDSPMDDSSAFHVYSPYGLDDAVIKTIPLSLYTAKLKADNSRECAVCLLEFEEEDYVRTLPVCAHAFHVECIDVWLRSHANCPLCRAGILRPESPFIPLMAARIRPSFDDDPILRDIIIEETMADLYSEETDAAPAVSEITEEQSQSPMRVNFLSEDRFRDFTLKRSYSFGFERSMASERMVMEPATTSPWRYRRSAGGSFWNKRASPFGSLSKPRVFSFRYYRGMKSPFFRRRGFFPLSESSVRFSSFGGGGGSSRRSKSMMSPMFSGRSSAAGAFSSSRLRCGDPEALLSPERFNRR